MKQKLKTEKFTGGKYAHNDILYFITGVLMDGTINFYTITGGVIFMVYDECNCRWVSAIYAIL